MKKKILIPIVITLLLLILVIPIPSGTYKDGGTREYTALTYKLVDWNRFIGDGENIYDKTKVYFFPNNLKSIDELWYAEGVTDEDNAEYSFVGTVLEINGSAVVVQPVEGSDMLYSSDMISFDTQDLEKIGAQVGSVVQVIYTGGIMESYPAQIRAKSWSLSGSPLPNENTEQWIDKTTAEEDEDSLPNEYTGQWIDKTAAKKCENNIFDHIVITEIYSNCFFARSVYAMPYQIKLNGTLSDEWCVGDQIICTYENTYYDKETSRIEADMLTVRESSLQLEAGVAYKPVIYLYPQEATEISVNLSLDGRLTCTYPAYNNGWNVTALPDGTLTDANGRTYNYLYWEGETYAQYDFSKGFCVKGKDTAEFLEAALEKLGLTRREANEFIVYWLPLMETNPFNIISFQTDAYTKAAQLEVDPAPDTLIRVFMAWKAADEWVALPEQKLIAPERTGFTVVEWGGTELK